MTDRPDVDGVRYVATCPVHETLAKRQGDGTYSCSRCGGRLEGWDVTDRETGRVVNHIEAGAAKRPAADAAPQIEFKWNTAKPKAGSQVVVAMAKLADASGTTVLDVRLVRRSSQPEYLIDWKEKAKASKDVSDRGRAWTGLDLGHAQKAFADTVGQSLAAGWILVPLLFGCGRAVPTRPVPPPPGARARGNEPAMPRPAKAPRSAQRKGKAA
ncbi:MAG: hypothetical protein KJ067_23330 [Vicinamibacteria bacterium]|nr:hypothetical protein [Vicinamibacteria bacterium]